MSARDVRLAFERSSPPDQLPEGAGELKNESFESASSSCSSDHFHGIDLVVLFRNLLAGIFGKPFFPLEACALLQREPVKVADRIVVASGIHHHLQRMCTRG